MKKIIQICTVDYMLWALTDQGEVYSLLNRPNEALEQKHWHKLPPLPDESKMVSTVVDK